MNRLPIACGLLLLVLTAPRGTEARERGDVFRIRDGTFVERLTRTLRATPGGTVVIACDQGTVKVDLWDRNEVRVKVDKDCALTLEPEARRMLEDFEVYLGTVEKDIHLRAESRSGRRSSTLSVRVQVIVPERVHVDVRSTGGIGVQKVSGNLDVQSAGIISIERAERQVTAKSDGGEIRVGESGGDLDASTVGGEIQVGKASGRVTVSTSGGGITVGPSVGDVYARTAGGEIRIAPSQSGVRAETDGGDIDVGGSGGPVRVSTSGGDIRIRGARGSIEAKTEGGSIEAELLLADRKADTHCTLETSGGDITLSLPESISASVLADLRIKRRTGRDYRIYSDFPLAIRSEDPGRILGSGEINGGGDPVRLSTVNGDITIRKLPGARGGVSPSPEERSNMAAVRHSYEDVERSRRPMEQAGASRSGPRSEIDASLEKQIEELERQLVRAELLLYGGEGSPAKGSSRDPLSAARSSVRELSLADRATQEGLIAERESVSRQMAQPNLTQEQRAALKGRIESLSQEIGLIGESRRIFASNREAMTADPLPDRRLRLLAECDRLVRRLLALERVRQEHLLRTDADRRHGEEEDREIRKRFEELQSRNARTTPKPR